MAEPNMTKNSDNQTIRHEQAKSEVSGGSDRQREQGMDKNAQDKSAIGGSESSRATSQTGEQGRARNELDESPSR